MKNLNKLKKAVEGVTAFERDGLLFVSAEDGQGFADYYGQFTGGYPYIDERLEKFAEKHGCYWEWQDAGCIVLAN